MSLSSTTTMGNRADKKFTWVIKNFFSLDSDGVYSDIFVAGDCKWRLLTYPIEKTLFFEYFCVYLCVPNSESLPSGWRRRAKVSFTIIINQIPQRSQLREAEYWFDQKNTAKGFQPMFDLPGRYNGFLVNGEVKIVAEVDVLEVIGKLDVPKEIIETSIDINGFQVLASQVESVNILFEKYPGFASKLCPPNPHLKKLKKAYLNIVLSLNETLCKSPEELSNGDLADAYAALQYVTKAGFKLDWLEKKLKETGQTRLQEIEEELKDLKLKYEDMDALLEFLR